jgi:hypothetical protein
MLTLKPVPLPKSRLPDGGRGTGLNQWDKAYLCFCRRYVEEQNAIWIDRHTHFGRDLPHYEPIDIHIFNVWMYERTDGHKHNPNDLVNYQHKIRHLAMTLRDDPDLIMNVAAAFVDDAYAYKE